MLKLKVKSLSAVVLTACLFLSIPASAKPRPGAVRGRPAPGQFSRVYLEFIKAARAGNGKRMAQFFSRHGVYVVDSARYTSSDVEHPTSLQALHGDFARNQGDLYRHLVSASQRCEPALAEPVTRRLNPAIVDSPRWTFTQPSVTHWQEHRQPPTRSFWIRWAVDGNVFRIREIGLPMSPTATVA